jgi:hypothetical protein
MGCLWNADPVVRMRAADAVEKISLPKPRLLEPFKAALLELLIETEQKELRWHLAQLIPRLPLSKKERQRAADGLRRYLRDSSSIVKTFALEGLTELAGADRKLVREIRKILEEAKRAGTPAMKARAHKLLKTLMS